MKLVITSDTHGYYPVIPKGDLFIHAGDTCAQGGRYEFNEFLGWMGKIPCGQKILIAGNHDKFVEAIGYKRAFNLCASFGVHYLQETLIEVDGVKIWGSPYTPEFFDWAFMYPRDSKVWDIPKCDILVTHGPPFGIMDKVHNGPNAGCVPLHQKVEEVKPDFHIFGHIHEGYGIVLGSTTFINASYVDRNYGPVNDIIEMEI